MAVLRRLQPALALVCLLPCVGLLACAPAGGPARILPGPSGRINPIYDFLAAYPDAEIIIGGLLYRGLDLDLEVEFDDASVRDADPLYAAEVRVVEVRAGGAPQAFELAGPLHIEGTLAGGVLTTGLFGPIRVGSAGLLLDLTGTLVDGSRRITGQAALFGDRSGGTFVAVKRRRYLVAGTDLQVIGKVSVVTVRYDTLIAIANDLEVISSDPIARVEDGRPFIVNRYQFDTLQGLDPFASFLTAFEYSTGNGSNPHDIVVLPADPGAVPADPGGGPAGEGSAGTAFVTRYEPPYNDVAVVDLQDGAVLEGIDLTPYARNRHRTPRPDQALLHDGLIYVTLQDADLTFTEFMNGRVAVIDPALRRVVDVIDLSGQNPFEALTDSEDTGLIYVGLAGIFPGLLKQALTGGIEVIDPATRRASLLVDDDALGGNVSAVTVHSATRGYCVVSDSAFRSFVKAFNPTTGEVLETIFESANLIATIGADGDGYLIVAEAGFFEPRLLIFSAETGQAVASLPARLPPFSVAVLTCSL